MIIGQLPLQSMGFKQYLPVKHVGKKILVHDGWLMI
jgi:hypothetical protein